VVSLAPFATRYAARAAVCTADGLAAGAGVDALRAGGCAVDAAIAAAAVLAVTQPHQCGLGGDLLGLVHRDGEPAPAALNASGRAGTGADPARLRGKGLDVVPATGHLAAAPVPGCVDGWLALHERFGRLDLADLLEPARRHAADGFAASAGLAAASQELIGVAGAEELAGLRAGQIVRRPGVARALAAIALEGRTGFYEGEFGEALVAFGSGEYTADDLATSEAEWVPPLGVEAFGRRLWTLPPNSQGYLWLTSAAIASSLELPDPDDPRWAQLLIDCSRAVMADREEVWHEGSDGEALVAPERIEKLRGRAGATTSAALPGDTVSLCVVDGDRMAVSILQSNFFSWGSKLFVPVFGFPLHNRGSSFSLRPGHPAEYGAGRRPPHTLSPALVTHGGALHAALATRGGHLQPQVLLQLTARSLVAGQSPAQCTAAPRWAVAEGELVVEGHAPESWLRALPGATVSPPFADAFGEAQLIVRHDDHLAAASDPRGLCWGVATL
jgi:gamma-glutamyltranspeptidase/glutathione hydrolase